MVTLELTAATRKAIEAGQQACAELAAAIVHGLHAACGVGAGVVVEHLVAGDLGLHMGNPGQGGLAGSVDGWIVDAAEPLGAIGVRGQEPAAAYAGIQEEGGTITPRHAKALAIPVSPEAKMYTSPRDQAGLVFIPSHGGTPSGHQRVGLLIRPLGGGAIEVHWVLVDAVTLSPTHWLSHGVELARPEMAEAMQNVLNEWSATWSHS